MNNQRALGIGLLCCLLAHAQAPPTPAPPEPPQDALGRTTPRGTVFGFLLAARQGQFETAAEFLNTRLSKPAAAVLANQLFVVLNRKLPAGPGLMSLSDKPEGLSSFLTKPNQNLIGTIESGKGKVEIVIERVDRGKAGQLWLFSNATLNAIPHLYEESSSIGKVIPQFLIETQIAKIPLFQWLAVFVGLPLLYLSIVILNWLLSCLTGYLRRRVRKRETLPNPQVLPMPVRLLMMALFIRWSLSNIDLPLLARGFWVTTTSVITIVGVVWGLMLLNGVTERFLLRRLQRFNRTEGVSSVLRFGRRVIDGFFFFAGILAGLRYFGVNLTAAMAGLGVGGIAIALAAQKTLENLIGGISVVFDKAVRVGELVKIGDQCGFVEHIGLRSTRIRTMDRTIVSIPNGQLANVSVETISIRDKFWFHHTLSLRRDTTPAMMRDILSRAESLLAHDRRVERDSARVRFLGFGTSSLDVEIVAYILAADWNSFLKSQQDLLLEVMEIVQSAGAELAYPSQTLYLSQSGTPDGEAEHEPNVQPAK